ncbi:peroxiredoxin-like family protein [Robertkochia aurantiaca]|uniref:peroxiredoxin-like family protein n=1 Tax=Robertkochia aurantiaca TaxID=2873700 RepID=UPI001CCC7F18|nr:peroxiredoxin-like family protein [Robertkochia sp. 3YJGBD-33]
MSRPIPKQKAPELSFNTLEGELWSLKDQAPQNFTLVVFYRGLHCPICKSYLQQLEELIPDFREKGVDAVAVSMDSEKRARLSRQKWDLKKLKLGYGLDQEAAKSWGLYLSEAIKDEEPDLFSEPGLFLIDDSNKVYYVAINSNPWGRPHLPSFLKAVDYINSSGYPARGEHN